MPDRSNRDFYQPLSQNINDEADVGLLGTGSRARATSSTRGLTRARPGTIDLKKLDNAFKRCGHPFPFVSAHCYIIFISRWTESIAHKVKRKQRKKQEHLKRQIWKSVFEPHVLSTSTSDIMVRCSIFSPAPSWHSTLKLTRLRHWTTNLR